MGQTMRKEWEEDDFGTKMTVSNVLGAVFGCYLDLFTVQSRVSVRIWLWGWSGRVGTAQLGGLSLASASKNAQFCKPPLERQRQ
jgi:hypothetical protein